MLENILFDLDGTLTDPMLGITNSVMYSLEKMGFPVPDRKDLLCFIGPPLLYSYQTYCGMDPEQAQQAVDAYREYFGVKGLLENAVFPGVPKFLTRLRRQGKKLYIATSKPEGYTLRILEHFDLLRYFDGVAAATMDASRHTKDKVVTYCLETFAIDPATAVMVGDREHDIQGGKVNGLRTVGVTFGYGPRQELEENGADAIADDFDELYNILMEM